MKKNNFIKEMLSDLKKEFSSEFIIQTEEKVFKNYELLIDENKNEPKHMWIHTRERIYPAIAMFKTLQKMGVNKLEAAKFIKDSYRKRSEKKAHILKTIMKIPRLYKFIPRLFAKMTDKIFNEASGFKSIVHKQNKTAYKFDIIGCPYFDICKKYHCQELVEMYCDADDICYGNMHPKINWSRSKTLGKGKDCCDFNISIIEDNKENI